MRTLPIHFHIHCCRPEIVQMRTCVMTNAKKYRAKSWQTSVDAPSTCLYVFMIGCRTPSRISADMMPPFAWPPKSWNTTEYVTFISNNPLTQWTSLRGSKIGKIWIQIFLCLRWNPRNQAQRCFTTKGWLKLQIYKQYSSYPDRWSNDVFKWWRNLVIFSIILTPRGN